MRSGKHGDGAASARRRAPLRRYYQRHIGGGHWIGSNADGKIITLEDGSIWQIAELDQIDTQLWLPVTDITVISDRSPVGEYKYILINKDDGEKAHAKYLGHE